MSAYLFVRLQPKEPNLPSYQPTYSKGQSYHPDTGRCRPETLAAIGDSRKRAAEAIDCEEKAEQYRLQSNDLVQQTRAADAAHAQAVSAYEQGWLTLWATLGGLWTLIAAGLAAAYARDAARQGKRSADAAHTEAENSGAALEQGKLGLRAWVYARPFTHLRVMEGMPMLVFGVEWVNAGQTPAINFVSNHRADKDGAQALQDGLVANIIGPGQVFSGCKIMYQLDQLAVHGLRESFRSDCVYNDIFSGEERKTLYRFVIMGGKFPPQILAQLATDPDVGESLLVNYNIGVTEHTAT